MPRSSLPLQPTASWQPRLLCTLHEWAAAFGTPQLSPALQSSDYVWVDPHILCTPAIADIDGDGVEEMVVAVSYYFDRAYYDSEVSPLHCAR